MSVKIDLFIKFFAIAAVCCLLYIAWLLFCDAPTSQKNLFGTISGETFTLPEKFCEEVIDQDDLEDTIPGTSQLMVRKFGAHKEPYQPYYRTHYENGIATDRELKDIRINPTRKFSEIPYKTPTWLVYHDENRDFLGRKVLVIKEVIEETAVTITRLVSRKVMDEHTYDRVMQRMSLDRDKFNLGNTLRDTIAFEGSVQLALDLFQVRLSDMQESVERTRRLMVLTGLQIGSYGRNWRRRIARFVARKQYDRIKLAVLGFTGCAATFTLFSIFGYVFSQVPADWRKKAAVGEGITKRLDVLNDNSVGIVGSSAIHYFNSRPDISNLDNLIMGREARLNNKMSDGVELGRVRWKPRHFIELVVEREIKNFVPVILDTPEQWVNTRKNYSNKKKQDIMCRLDTYSGQPLDSMFVKNESYGKDFKAPRIISNSEKAEVAYEGPVVSAFENQFEELPSILSGNPVCEWSNIVSEKFGPYQNAWNIFVLDHSSFEGSCSKQVKDLIENKVYDQLLKNYPTLAAHLRHRQDSRKFVKFAKCRGSNCKQIIRYDMPIRCSGDCRTYQANSLTNHFLLLSLQEYFGFTGPFMVSGDDGLIAVPKNISISQLQSYFKQAGFNTKLALTEIHNSGFCGFNYDPNNNNKRLVANLVDTIIDFFYTPQKNISRKHYLDYVYDKALCFLHEYVADPVLRPALAFILQRPRRYNINSVRTDWWHQFLMSCSNSKIQDLLSLPTSSFEVSSKIHVDQLTAAEEKQLSELFLRAVQDVYLNEGNGSELTEWLRKWDTYNGNKNGRLRFNDLAYVESEDSLYMWSPTAYEELFRF